MERPRPEPKTTDWKPIGHFGQSIVYAYKEYRKLVDEQRKLSDFYYKIKPVEIKTKQSNK